MGVELPTLPFYHQFRLAEADELDLGAQGAVADEIACGAQAGGMFHGEAGEVAVGAVAVGVAGIGGSGGDSEFHQVIPKCGAAEQRPDGAAAGDGFAGNRDRLAAAAQNDLHAPFGGEGQRRIGIGKRGKDLAQGGEIDLPTRPAEAGGAADQRAAEEDFAQARFVFAGDAEDVLDEVANGKLLHDHGSQRDGFGGFRAQLYADGGWKRHS